MSEIAFDRQKYLDLLKTDGLHVALTQLHHDIRDWENQTFEGQNGWQPNDWQELERIRAFSRELWDIGLSNPAVNAKQDLLFKD